MSYLKFDLKKKINILELKEKLESNDFRIFQNYDFYLKFNEY